MTEHLVGGYGLFWHKDEVNWNPGPRRNWQLLGKVGTNAGTLQVCDFRRAKGFYVLFDDYGPHYVGLARGNQGIGQRLQAHVRDDNKSWSRFCFFCFDDVITSDDEGWSELKPRDSVQSSSAERIVRELEALLIITLGTRGQNQMKFANAREWAQVTSADTLPREALTKVSRSRLTDHEMIRYLSE